MSPIMSLNAMGMYGWNHEDILVCDIADII